MADIMTPPAPGMAMAGADRPKPGDKGKKCDAVTIRRAGNGFIVEKSYEGGGGLMDKPDVAPSLEEAFNLGYAALGGGGGDAGAPPAGPPAGPEGMAPPAGPDTMGGAPEESGMPSGAPPERPGVKYDEGGPTPEPEEERV